MRCPRRLSKEIISIRFAGPNLEGTGGFIEPMMMMMMMMMMPVLGLTLTHQTEHDSGA